MTVVVVPPSFGFEVVSVDPLLSLVRVRAKRGWFQRALEESASASGAAPLQRSEGGVQWKNGKVQLRAGISNVGIFPCVHFVDASSYSSKIRVVSLNRLEDFVARLESRGFLIVECRALGVNRARETHEHFSKLVKESFRSSFGGGWSRGAHRLYDWQFKQSVETLLLCLRRISLHIPLDVVESIIRRLAPTYERVRFTLVT